MRTWILAASVCILLGCSDDDVNASADSGSSLKDGLPARDRGKVIPDKKKVFPDKGKVLTDKGKADASAFISEKEPNDGKTPSDLNLVTWPAAIVGSIGKAGDTDIFGINVKAGDRFVVKVKAGGPFQPHLVIFDPLGKLPTAANAGPSDLFAEYYCLKSGALYIGLRDRRNVAKPPKNVGGPAFTYTLSIERLKRAPTPVTVSKEISSSLAPRGVVRVFSFSATKGLDMQITVDAKKLSTPSQVDSRLSLFHPGQKIWAGTNDDATSGLSDSLLKGPMPFTGTYHAIVENVKIDATDLRFAFRATTIK